MMNAFLLAKKIKSKWYGVAESNDICLYDADKAFRSTLGIDGWTQGYKSYWRDSFESQKNYAGRLPEFKSIST